MIARLRRVLPVTAILLTMVFVAPARAALTWGPTHRVGPPSTWNPGSSLASTPRGLVTVWSSDCPPPKGRCATDKGPYMGVFAQRHRTTGWSPPVRISQSRAQAERATVAAFGSHVLAGWVTQTSYRRYRPRAQRVFYVRRSADAGRTWSAPIQLSPKGARVDYPTLAMAGTAAYAVWTRATTGAIRLATSADFGAHWNVATIGMTTARPAGAEGFAGYPVVGASGTNVVVTWYADDAGAQVAKVSSVGGSDWTPAPPADTLTPSGPNDGYHYAGARGATDGVSNDVAVAYTTAGGLAVRTYDGSSLGAERPVLSGSWPTTLRGLSYAGAYGPAVQPSGNGELTVAFGACRVGPLANPCASTLRGARIDTFVTTSPDHGGSWSTPLRLNPSSRGGAPVNESPSLAMVDATTRVVLWNARDSAFRDYGLRMRIGRG